MTPGHNPTMRRKWRVRSVAAVLGTIAILTVAACSGGDADVSVETSAPASSAEAADTTVADSVADSVVPATEPTDDTAAPAVTALIEVSVSPGVTPGLEGALQDVTERACTESDGGWTTTGTLTNPGTVTYDYRVYTAFMSSTDEMLALVQSDLSGVAPGAEAAWETSAAIGDVQDVSCVLRVERNSVAAPPASTP